MALLHPLATVEYPSSDGLPMAESDFQRKPLTYAVAALDIYFQHRTDVYVSGHMFIYYEEGNPEAMVAPDVFVVLGMAKRERSSYFLWQEPKGPDFVLEITSRRTRSQDQGPKRGTYAFLGAQEYFQYDPTGDYLRPPLQGLRLVGDHDESLPTSQAHDGALSVSSAVLGLALHVAGGVLHFYDPMTGQNLLSHREAEQARQESEAQAQAALAALRAAEARIAALEACVRAMERPQE
jgi:Uma2 family endonuclease